MVVCPHCKERRFFPGRPPKDVLVVLQCPSCRELAIVFRHKVIPLSQRIIEKGTREERVTHYATILDELLQAGFLRSPGREGTPPADAAPPFPGDESSCDFEPDREPITNEEFERFHRIELRCIDNAAYFKRHFG